MQPSELDLAETYRRLPDEEVAALYSQIDTLTESARIALTAEAQRRQLTGAVLDKLYNVELRHEARFDRLEKLRRKKLVLGSLGLGDIWGWIIVIAGALVLVLIEKLIAHH